MVSAVMFGSELLAIKTLRASSLSLVPEQDWQFLKLISLDR